MVTFDMSETFRLRRRSASSSSSSPSVTITATIITSSSSTTNRNTMTNSSTAIIIPFSSALKRKKGNKNKQKKWNNIVIILNMIMIISIIIIIISTWITITDYYNYSNNDNTISTTTQRYLSSLSLNNSNNHYNNNNNKWWWKKFSQYNLNNHNDKMTSNLFHHVVRRFSTIFYLGLYYHHNRSSILSLSNGVDSISATIFQTSIRHHPIQLKTSHLKSSLKNVQQRSSSFVIYMKSPKISWNDIIVQYHNNTNSTISDFGGLNITIMKQHHHHHHTNMTNHHKNNISMLLYHDNISSSYYYNQRFIPINDYQNYELYRNNTLTLWDIDDGLEHEKYYSYDDIDYNETQCIRPKWSYDIHSTCNQIHEVVIYDRSTITTTMKNNENINNNIDDDIILNDYEYHYLAHGYYRESFYFHNNNNKYLKQYTYNNNNIVQQQKSSLKLLRNNNERHNNNNNNNNAQQQYHRRLKEYNNDNNSSDNNTKNNDTMAENDNNYDDNIDDKYEEEADYEEEDLDDDDDSDIDIQYEILEEFVMKSLRYERNMDRDDYSLIYGEAVALDVLSSSNNIANIYGYCGDSIILEYGYEIENKIVGKYNPNNITTTKRGFISQYELNQLETINSTNGGVYPMNQLNIDEKLQMAIEISESIAEQHGYYNGIMMNDDIEIKQWLQRKRRIIRTSNNTNNDNKDEYEYSLFLNDLGNTIFRSYHIPSQNYCETYVQYGGDYKSPEEFKGSYVDESADIWPIGNIIYTLITGLHPYYNISTTISISKHLELIWNATQSYVPYINPIYYNNRSYIEHEMINIMKLCHQHDPLNRSNIFDIVKKLHKIKHTHQKQQKQQQQYNNHSLSLASLSSLSISSKVVSIVIPTNNNTNHNNNNITIGNGTSNLAQRLRLRLSATKS